jgi:hypothetical protein
MISLLIAGRLQLSPAKPDGVNSAKDFEVLDYNYYPAGMERYLLRACGSIVY